ncbi:hypothetical protein NDU88_003779 [Pleurodeles waltl]|uniref:Uncharacterized protein n=1 Tax=Pleurodeles waltl TaxID=8319 RepID=A0AAV7LJJ4_PLEWA|nr:hypothetical protein NDU88_003779 [Pleurodeles waltl]
MGDIWCRKSIQTSGGRTGSQIIDGRPPPGETLHPIIARLLNYCDRDVVLCLARKKAEIKHHSNSVAFHPDFTMVVQAARRELILVKKKLNQMGIKYAMLYPARLRIEHQGSHKIVATPKAVWDCVNTIKDRQGDKAAEDLESQKPSTLEGGLPRVYSKRELTCD